MAKEIDVRMGEMAVGSGKTVINTGGVGSCIVIILYDNTAKVGGLAHSVLPSKKDDPRKDRPSAFGDDEEPVAKYADEAARRMAKEIVAAGGKKERLEARLIGGSHMFKSMSNTEEGIGNRNIECARKTLAELGIPIDSEEVGGSVGRNVELDLENGLVSVTTKM